MGRAEQEAIPKTPEITTWDSFVEYLETAHATQWQHFRDQNPGVPLKEQDGKLSKAFFDWPNTHLAKRISVEHIDLMP